MEGRREELDKALSHRLVGIEGRLRRAREGFQRVEEQFVPPQLAAAKGGAGDEAASAAVPEPRGATSVAFQVAEVCFLAFFLARSPTSTTSLQDLAPLRTASRKHFECAPVGALGVLTAPAVAGAVLAGPGAIDGG